MGIFIIDLVFLNHIKSCQHKNDNFDKTYPSTIFGIMKVNGDMDVKQ